MSVCVCVTVCVCVCPSVCLSVCICVYDREWQYGREQQQQSSTSYHVTDAAQSAVIDLLLLADTNMFIGTMTSSLSRNAYELMCARAGHLLPFISLDSAWLVIPMDGPTMNCIAARTYETSRLLPIGLSCLCDDSRMRNCDATGLYITYLRAVNEKL